jgi:hypothetical protein
MEQSEYSEKHQKNLPSDVVQDIHKRMSISLVLGVITLCCLGVTFLFFKWLMPFPPYIARFDELTPLYEDELTEVMNDYFRILALRDPETHDPSEVCASRTVDEAFDWCVSVQYMHGDFGFYVVDELRVITQTPDCATIIVKPDWSGGHGGIPGTYRLDHVDGVWKIAETAGGYTQDMFGQQVGLMAIANPPMPFSCTEE